jgi:hypothetical protein
VADRVAVAEGGQHLVDLRSRRHVNPPGLV